MENIKEFKELHVYDSNGNEVPVKDYEKLGMDPVPHYETLEESAYQAAYDISNDWAKEQPDWEDVKEAYRRGAEDGIAYGMRVATDTFKKITMGTGLF